MGEQPRLPTAMVGPAPSRVTKYRVILRASLLIACGLLLAAMLVTLGAVAAAIPLRGPAVLVILILFAASLGFMGGGLLVRLRIKNQGASQAIERDHPN